MQIQLIAQTNVGGLPMRRVGDILNAAIADVRHERFKFAVAYMRTSGINRLRRGIRALTARAGSVAGAVGLDDEVTTSEALETLAAVSTTSTVFHTVSGFIYHPKLYLAAGRSHAVVILGSPNLTRDGLYRNVEAATLFDLALPADAAVLREYEAFIDAFLDASHPNVKALNSPTIQRLLKLKIIKSERETREPGPPSQAGTRADARVEAMFPRLQVPVAPPEAEPLSRPTAAHPARPRTAAAASVFVMQMSAFDCSHRTGSKGTAEVLIPHGAVGFFPPISVSDRKYPDAFFPVAVNTETGVQRFRYRFWYYEQRATGTRIDEYRLRMNKVTIDQSRPGGGDILVINRVAGGAGADYEVTIVNQGDAEHADYLAMCDQRVQVRRRGARRQEEKAWGIYLA